RRALVAALLEAHEVVDADAGQHGQLLPAQAGCAAPTAARQADLSGRHALAPGPQEPSELTGVTRHGVQCARGRAGSAWPCDSQDAGVRGRTRPAPAAATGGRWAP